MGNLLSLEQRASRAMRSADDLDDDVQLIRADSIRIVPINWLWKGWLARGKLHILAGAPGTGKTTIALALAAAVTRGSMLPDGTRAPCGNVLIWSGEDDPADTIAPRLKAAGADMSKVCIIGDVGYGDDARPFDPASDMMALERAAETFGDIALLVADPVVSAVSGDSHKNTEVRRALQPMVNLGRRLQCAVLGISHFSKGTSGREPVERVTGSVAFGALARIVLVTAKGEDGARLLARAKSNIGPDGGGFGYSLEMSVEGGMEASRVCWGNVLEGSARELLGDAEAVGDSPRADAEAWLEEMLSGAEVATQTLKSEATAAGYTWRTMERAKADLGIVAERQSIGNDGKGRWFWKLPDKAATSKTANPTTDYGGLAEMQSPCGFDDSQDRKTATFQVDGVAGGLASHSLPPLDAAVEI